MGQLYKQIVLLFFVPLSLFALGKVIYKEISPEISPWLTGPLLAPASQVVPAGHYNIEPYVYATAITGAYHADGSKSSVPTFWSIISQTPIQIGVTSWMNMFLTPTFSWNYSQHTGKVVLDDSPIGIDIQLYPGSSSIPAFMLVLTELIPLGKYRNLNPEKRGTDISGFGSWDTQIGLTIGHLFYLGGVHFLNSRLFLNVSIPAPVHLEGFNTYGGGIGTNARFFPAKALEADLGLELTLTRNWALALDVVGIWTTKPHYSGFPGTTVLGGSASLDERAIRRKATLGYGPSIEYSLAPAVEYNWSSDVGLIGGLWFTFAGRKTPVFYSGVFAFNYYH